MNIEFDGLDELIESIDNIVSEDQLEAALKKCCLLVERSAKIYAPKGDSGHLRDSIKSTVEGDTGIVFTALDYAPYVEYGTGIHAENGGGRTWDLPWCYQDEKGEWHYSNGQPPMPFMRPALNVNREEIVRILGENLIND